MAGGVGERFWPLSKPERPKQLLNLTHPEETMLEQAIFRLLPLTDQAFVSTSKLLEPAIVECGLLPESHILAEPEKRNTLGALCWTVASLMARGLESACLAVVTADHYIGDVPRFRGSVRAAMELAESAGGIVTLGIRPTRAETGYGYIEIGDQPPADLSGGFHGHRAAAFREKPDAELAETYVASGHHFWNSGMFIFTVPEFLRELKAANPEAHDLCSAIADLINKDDERGAAELFSKLPNLSIDYAVMEKAERVLVIPVDFPWDDVGAWDALARTLPLDDNDNATQGDIMPIDTKASIIVNDEPGKLVAVLGVENIVVVNTADAVLVCDKAQAQKVRQIAARIAELKKG